MNIKIPKSFKDILDNDQRLTGIVNTVLHNFGDILDKNELFFFPEYTDHGKKHIESILFASEEIITQNTIKQILSPKDIAIYILAVILHDLGMHLSLEGFNTLFSDQYKLRVNREFDLSSWELLWKNYINEVYRFSGKMRRKILGNENVEIRTPPIKIPLHFDFRDRLITGEFIRRHHPRIAHEIALKGFPAHNGSVIPFAEGLEKELLDLAGLIARSHGMDLRRNLEYIEEIFPDVERTPFNIHVVFLMVILRISDYLQIDSKRTSDIWLKTKTLQSPISQFEHKSHLSIKYIEKTHQADPERIYVHANPEDSAMFVKLQNLINSIQYEFDISWAILGELYGREVTVPKLKYRRIISNLPKLQQKKNINYLPEKISFKANEDLLLLLIAPLYGDDPLFGVRELLQNAVDACNERDGLESKGENYTGEVIIWLNKEDNKYFFMISDNGKGMNSMEIKNYFLNAGASYRSSQDWKNRFIDDFGNSRIKRSGKFGIGVLAAFLLGNQISVRTRRFDESRGLAFDAKINDEQIEVKYIPESEMEIGTIISIEISESVFRKLENESGIAMFRYFDWFRLAKPIVKYFENGIEVNKYEKRNFLPNDKGITPVGWHEIIHKDYNQIFWSYDPKHTVFTCNGIVIPDASIDTFENAYIERSPSLSIFDNNGRLPVSLNRAGLTRNLSFISELESDILKDLIAWLLLVKNKSIERTKTFNENFFDIDYHPSLGDRFHESILDNVEGRYSFGSKKASPAFFNQFFWGSEGYFPANEYFMHQEINKPIIIFFSGFWYNLFWGSGYKKKSISKGVFDKFWFSFDFGRVLRTKSGTRDFLTRNLFETLGEGTTVFFPKEILPHESRLSGYVKRACSKLFEGEYLTSFTKSGKQEMEIPEVLRVIEKRYPKSSGVILNKLPQKYASLTEPEYLANNWMLYQLLNKYFSKEKVIPYENKKKVAKYSAAFSDLENFMRKYL